MILNFLQILKNLIYDPDRPFWGPWRSSVGSRGPYLVPTLPNWLVCVGLMVITHFDLVSGPFWTPGGPKRARFGPNAPFGDLGGSRGALGDQIWSQRPPTGSPGLDSWSPHTLTWYQASSGPPETQKGPLLAQNVPDP